MRCARWLVPTALTLALAGPALAEGDAMRVNEISPSGGWVELINVAPDGGAPFFHPAYVVRSYDGAANELDSRTYVPPVPFADPEKPFVLSLSLPAGGGQVCFERQRNANSSLPVEEYRYHCMGYGAVTKPAMRRMLSSGPRPIKMPVAPLPGAGESVQRQACGRAVAAPATQGAENVVVRRACAGLRTACDDPRKWDTTTPRMKVTTPREHDIDRPLFVKVRMNERGSISMRGAGFGGHSGFPYGPIVRKLKKNKTIRIRIPFSRKAKSALKRELGRGQLVRVSAVSVGKDNACFPNRFHSSRIITLKP
jgi:hypothetical protein